MATIINYQHTHTVHKHNINQQMIRTHNLAINRQIKPGLRPGNGSGLFYSSWSLQAAE